MCSPDKMYFLSPRLVVLQITLEIVRGVFYIMSGIIEGFAGFFACTFFLAASGAECNSEDHCDCRKNTHPFPIHDSILLGR